MTVGLWHFDDAVALHHFERARLGRRDRRLDRGATRRIERGENILNTIGYDPRLPDADLDPSECIALKCLQDRGDAPMPARSAGQSSSNGANRRIEVVVHQNTLLGLEGKSFGKLPQHGTTLVHVRSHLHQAHGMCT